MIAFEKILLSVSWGEEDEVGDSGGCSGWDGGGPAREALGGDSQTGRRGGDAAGG